MTRATPRIRTPDQRLRVFVSSTLGELAAERRAVRAAIEQLRLAPVMFELGARPHPPRELYRAYLDQSEVFVGIYGARYGWVAPGETISGLEDEYRLAGDLPKLLYLRDGDDREPRLTELLDRIRDDDGASYKSFADPAELAELVAGDLAVLLAERFEQSRFGAGAPEPAPVTGAIPVIQPTDAALPTPATELIGRNRELRAVLGMLADGARLVTLTGPGGIGKSRLALDVAARVAADGEPVAFVDLAPVTSTDLVPGAIAAALGIRDTGEVPIGARLTTALREQRMLLVLDNVEQLVDAAPLLGELLAEAPGIRAIATSRTLLRIAAERSYEVGPLALPPAGAGLEALGAVPSVALFLERARALRPDLELTTATAPAIARLCAALDGVPLAIELAAARIRVLSPDAMVQRLDRQLALLVGGARDLPARQRTLRSTIEWSVDLLAERERDALAELGVFRGGFSLDAAEALACSPDIDATEVLGALVDSSLVQQRGDRDGSRFGMLATVREYAGERLAELGRLDDARDRHAAFFGALAARAEPELKGPEQAAWVERLADDRDNLRAAVRHLLDDGELDAAARLAWRLYMFWWLGGLLGEVRGWMDELLQRPGPVEDGTRAIALYFTGAIGYWQSGDDVLPGLLESAELFAADDDGTGQALALVSAALARLARPVPDAVGAGDDLERSLAAFRSAGDRWGEAMALVMLGRVALLEQRLPAALARFEESMALTRAQDDELGAVIAENHAGWAHLLLGEVDAATALFAEGLQTSAAIGHAEGVAYGLEALVAVAVTRGDPERAGLLLGAAESIRRVAGLTAGVAPLHDGYVAAGLASPGGAAMAAARERGRGLGVAEAVEAALAPGAKVAGPVVGTVASPS